MRPAGVKSTPSSISRHQSPLLSLSSSLEKPSSPPILPQPPPPLSKAAAAAAYYAAAVDAGIDDPPPPPPHPTSAFAPLIPAPPFDPTAGLEPWQAGILAAAYLQGKRKVSVQAVAAAADVDRAGVLAWFKAVDGLLASTLGGLEEGGEAGRAAAKASALAALVAAGEADTAVAGRAAESAAARAAAAEAATLAEGRAWSPTPADRRFSAAALATLERVFEEVSQ